MANELEKKEVIYVCNPQINTEDDEIDLRELCKTMWKHKKFIIIFTLAITLLAGIYVFFKTPIYQIKSDIQVGYLTNNTNTNTYFIAPNSLVVYLKNNYTFKNKLPKIEINKLKRSNDIIEIKINDVSNKKAEKWLNNILKNINLKEDIKIKILIHYVNNQVDLLNGQIKEFQQSIKSLQEKEMKTNNYKMTETLNQSILNYQNQLLNLKIQINNYKNQLNNITKSHLIGKIQINNYPVKPKKKLIIVVAFITGFILAIFLVFFIEFIKDIKEEKPKLK